MLLNSFVNIISNLDAKIGDLAAKLGGWTYVVFFLCIFLETAFLIFLFLPSDAVVFSVTALTVTNPSLSAPLLFIIAIIAALLGDSCCFFLGHLLKNKKFTKKNYAFVDKETIKKTRNFFIKHGRLVVFLARFIPFCRAPVPFIIGKSNKPYNWFIKYNAPGTFVWGTFYILLGHFVGRSKFVINHPGLVALAVPLLLLIMWGLSILLTKILHNRYVEKLKRRRLK